MAFDKSFFSRLFRRKLKAAEEPETETQVSPPQPKKSEVKEKPPQRHRLELPQDHAVYKLWTLYHEQAGWSPRPELFLEGPQDPIIPEEEAKTEAARLQTALLHSANGRMKLIESRKKKPEEGEEGPPPLPDVDAMATVFLSKNDLTAWLVAYPPVGSGKELDRGLLEQALRQQKVSFGVDETLLDTLPKDPERYFRLFPVARGEEAVPGKDGSIEDLYPRSEERKLIEDENHRVDYKNLNFIHNVEKGAPICRIHLPTEGTPGRTVRDREITVKKGSAASVPKGRNTEISEDGEALIASIAGHVEFIGRSFQVKPVMEIPGNVDFSVGNINFLGDVCVRGDVCSGFTVRATGSITIDGVVEASTIEAGRDLVMARGVQGDNQAVIRAQRSIFAKFLENCSVYAKQDLETECIINCDVCCDGTVTVCSGHSKIIGGEIHAAHEVIAGIIGSRGGQRTKIVLGGQPCEDFDYNLLNKEAKELAESEERVKRQPESPAKSGQMARLRVQRMQNRSKLEAISKERELRTAVPPDTSLCRMKCDTVYPGTKLTIEDVVYRFENVIAPCCASLVDGEIRLI